jgi:hypothetical protein
MTDRYRYPRTMIDDLLALDITTRNKDSHTQANVCIYCEHGYHEILIVDETNGAQVCLCDCPCHGHPVPANSMDQIIDMTGKW